MDYIIRGGTIIGGTNCPPYKADIAINKGRIQKICPRLNINSATLIDADGLYVSPGFIDIHTHADLFMLDQQRDPINLKQGVTSEITGNCGFSPAPLSTENAEILKEYAVPVMGSSKSRWSWELFSQYVSTLDKRDYINNWGTLVGNGAIRIAVKGFSSDPMDKNELSRAQSLLSDALDSGAKGLSLGLMYIPEFYYKSTELKQLCRVLKGKNKIITAHIRGEGSTVTESVKEILELGREAEVPVHISHLKAAGMKNWRTGIKRTLDLIDQYREQGQDISCDLYPYEASSTMLSSLLPPWIMEGGNSAAVCRLADNRVYRQCLIDLKKEFDNWDNLVLSTGWNRVIISSAPDRIAEQIVGKSVLEIAELRGKEAEETALDLFIESKGAIGIIFYSMCTDDMDEIIARDYSFFISDTLYPPGGFTHPRGFGSFSKIIQDYVVKRKRLTLPQAVKKMTSMPAQRMNIADRGEIKEGGIADILLFDPEEIQSPASFQTPNIHSRGMNTVLLNGKPVLRNNQLINSGAGQFLKD